MTSDLKKSDLYELLLKSNSDKKFYFESKDSSSVILALGPTEEIHFKEAPEYLKKNPDLLIWSAMNFENVAESTFHASYLTLVKRNNLVDVIINPRINWDPSLCFSEKKLIVPNLQSSTVLKPDFSDWTKMLNEALLLLSKKSISKIVLKRKKIITFKNIIDSLNVFKTTSKNAKDSYKIFAQMSSSQAFISFTPEKLFSLSNNKQIETMSLAGSVPRGKNSREESKLEDELLNSEKLIHEQKIVTDEINMRLKSIATEVNTSALSIMKLQYIQHRANNITAKLNSDKNILDIITTLHPTPAVGGNPNNTALSTIINLEQDVRNNYAAPIGYYTSDYSEFAVGLRSASIEKNTLTIYAGCGIVSGSIPEMEWIETETKMKPFANIFSEGNSYA